MIRHGNNAESEGYPGGVNLDDNTAPLPAPENPEAWPREDTHDIWWATRRGKIARLPRALREEVNRHLLQEQPDQVLLAWLNARPEVRPVLLPYFKDTTVTPQNLSDYRYGSFREWLKKEEQERRTRELAEYAVRIGAGPGVDLGRASAALLHSQLILLMEPMHSLITAMANGVHMEERIKLICEDMARLGQVLHLVRQGEHQAELLRLKAEQVAISRERLELAKAAQQLAREKWAFKMSNDQGACARPVGDTKMSNEPISKVLAHGHQGEAKAWDNTGLLNDLGPVMFPKHWTGVEKPDSAYTPEELAARRRQQAEDSAVSWARTQADQKYYNQCYMVAQQLITGASALPIKLSPEVFAHLETPAALGRTEEEMRAVVAEVQNRAEASVRFPIEQKIQLAAERAEYEQRTGLDAETGEPLAHGHRGKGPE
jgi:hypothetical protein